MARDLPVPYVPAPPPTVGLVPSTLDEQASKEDLEEVISYLYEELHRLSASLAADVIAFSITDDDTYLIDATPAWEQIFLTIAADWDLPGGTWDPVTGTYTISQFGLYSISAQATVDPFGSGNKSYYAGLAVVVAPGAGSPTVAARFEAFDGGADDVPLGLSITGSAPLYQGDQLQVEFQAAHEQFTGSIDVEFLWQLVKVG